MMAAATEKSRAVNGFAEGKCTGDVRALLLDAGGVLVYPTYGSWLKTKDYDHIMEKYLRDIPPEKHWHAVGLAAQKYNDAAQISTEEEEVCRDRAFFTLCYRETLGLPITDAELDALAYGRGADPDRFSFYEDALPALKYFHERYKLALVSDTTPLLITFFKKYDALQYFDALSVSYEHGVLKPAPVMYTAALERLGERVDGLGVALDRRGVEDLGVAPEEALFIDDLEKNLDGAASFGIRTVKMERSFYGEERKRPGTGWKGPVVKTLLGEESLEELLEKTS